MLASADLLSYEHLSEKLSEDLRLALLSEIIFIVGTYLIVCDVGLTPGWGTSI